MSEKKFRIHSPSELTDVENAIVRKADGNLVAGRSGYSIGDISPFKGHEKKQKEGEFGVTLIYTPETQREIIERVSQPVLEIAKSHGIQMIGAGAGDMDPHLVLQPANLVGLTPEQKREIVGYLEENRYLDMISKILTGIEFDLDQLVPAGRDVYIGASKFTPDIYPIYKARKLIRKVYSRMSGTKAEEEYDPEKQYLQSTKKGIFPVNYDSIVHTTAARIVGLEGVGGEDLMAFEEDVLSKVGNDISARPVHAVVSSVRSGLSSDIIESIRGELISS